MASFKESARKLDFAEGGFDVHRESVLLQGRQ
jgi:hypothetical protein